jgi:hypothetical protein
MIHLDYNLKYVLNYVCIYINYAVKYWQKQKNKIILIYMMVTTFLFYLLINL